MYIFEGKKSIWMGATATILEEGRDLAWAERTMHPNPMYKYVLGRYAAADVPNNNRQMWSYKDLAMAQPTIQWAPMNLLHQPRRITGTWVDTEMIYPTDSAGEEETPFIESLGVFWRYYFEDEYQVIEAAHQEGKLFISMECVGDTVTCAGPEGCGKDFAYAGPAGEDYCEHLKNRTSVRQINNPHFLAGALLVPPAKPGWSNANVMDLSTLVAENAEECEEAFEIARDEMPDGSPQEWENMMAMIVGQATQEPGLPPQAGSSGKSPEALADYLSDLHERAKAFAKSREQ